MRIYSEIKLWEPTEETCSNMERIIEKYQETSASKALTRSINDIGYTDHIIADLTDELGELRKLNELQELELYKSRIKLADIRSTYQRLNSLLLGDKNTS